MAKNRRWVIKLDYNADPDTDPRTIKEQIKEWYDSTRGFVCIDGDTVEIGDPNEAMELKLRFYDHVVSVKRVKV